MVGAASMALLRRRVPGAPCVESVNDGGCDVELSRWKEAWLILRAGLNKVRRTASEGVEAIKLELGLSTAVGLPGLVGFQYIVDRYTPLRFEALLEEALRESLEDIQIGSRKLVLNRFTIGKKPPQLLAARVYDIGPDALGFDFDTTWDSELVAQLAAVPDMPQASNTSGTSSLIEAATARAANARVPVTVRNLRFSGMVRVVVTNLTSEDPGAHLASADTPIRMRPHRCESTPGLQRGMDCTRCFAAVASRLGAASLMS